MDERLKHSFEARQRAKQAARDEDDRAIASGEKSPEQVQREACAFSAFAHAPIDFGNTDIY